jgi:acyl-CoA thioester hydrolase
MDEIVVDARPSASTDLASYPVVITLPVQWGDQDAFQHVNNVVYFRWYESARIAYSSKIGLMDLLREHQIGPILAATANDYRRQITFPDTVDVGVRVVRIGRASLGMEHAIFSRTQQQIAATGTSTLVVFDYNQEKPHPVPDSIRQAIEDLEGRSL